MAKAKARKETGKGGSPLPVNDPDGAGPCAQVDQAVAECQSQVSAIGWLLVLMQNPPTVPSRPVYNPTTQTGSWVPE